MTFPKTEKRMLASVIILTKNGALYLRSLLDALADQVVSGHFEVIVIDSGSKDDTLDIIREFPEVRLHEIPPEEFGHGKTRNLGGRLASGEFLVYIPQDATPVGSEWLERLLRAFRNPAVAGVYARQIPRPEANAMEGFFLLEAYPPVPNTRTLAVGEEATLARCFFSTVSGAVRASIWADHPFREDIIMSEDQAWASTVMQAGFSIAYEPGSCVLHSHQYRVPEVFRRNFDSGYSIQQIYKGKTGMPAWHVMSKLIREIAFVICKGGMSDWLRFLPYESARYCGFFLGVHAERLPASLRKECSSLRYFWDRPVSPHEDG